MRSPVRPQKILNRYVDSYIIYMYIYIYVYIYIYTYIYRERESEKALWLQLRGLIVHTGGVHTVWTVPVKAWFRVQGL